MPDNDIDWDEIDRISAEKRRKSRERTGRAISAAMRDSSGIDRIEAIPDDVWQAAVEADAKEKQSKKKPRAAKPKKRASSRRPGVIDMVCPLCGHDKVKRYPYEADGWQYVCEGCRCAFDPDYHRRNACDHNPNAF